MSCLTIADLSFCDVAVSSTLRVRGGDGFGIFFSGATPIGSFAASANASDASKSLATYSINGNGFTATVGAEVSGAVAGAVGAALANGSSFTSVFTTAVTA